MIYGVLRMCDQVPDHLSEGSSVKSRSQEKRIRIHQTKLRWEEALGLGWAGPGMWDGSGTGEGDI